MPDTDWASRIRNLPSELGVIYAETQGDGLRAALVLAWTSLAQAHGPAVGLYRSILESELAEAADTAQSRLGQPCFGFVVPVGADERSMVLAVGALLRALENMLSDTDSGGRPVDPEDDWSVEARGQQFYVIPMPRYAWRATPNPEQDRRPFGQRGLLKLRVVPKVVDGAAVRIVHPIRPSSSASPGGQFGAILFDGVEFEEDQTAKDFLVTAATLIDGEQTVTMGVEQAHVDGCVATVFPELTIDPGRREIIRSLLVTKPWLDATGTESINAPSVVVAGSWHESDEKGDTYNVATVFDGDGTVLLKHRKRYGFVDREGRRERTSIGPEFSVLVLGVGLVAFGICLDYCQRFHGSPYGELDVDVVLVPSCGGDVTMDGHIRTCLDLHDQRKSRAFVVQQAYPDLPDHNGYVLPPKAPTANLNVVELRVADRWSVHSS